jgi:tetratricopeptide (TPR) repeat protein
MANEASPDGPGLGPVLDLLGKMESQVGGIANSRPGEVSAVSAADEELRNLREELLSADQRGYEQLESFTRALEDLKHAVPTLIDETVNQRFLEIEETFHRNVKEIHTRSMDAFTQSVQAKIGQRIAALETNLSLHTEAMGQLREHYLKTDRNVQRLISGLDRLTAELMRLSTNASPNLPRTIYAPAPVRTEKYEKSMRPEREESRPYAQPSPPVEAYEEEPEAEGERYRRVRKRRARRTSPLIFAFLGLIVLVPLGLVGWSIYSGGGLLSKTHTEAVAAKPDALSGTAAQMRLAADYTADKDYVKAEGTYRLILKSDPANREAIKELASVLFRQQKYDEAAAVLKTLPPE